MIWALKSTGVASCTILGDNKQSIVRSSVCVCVCVFVMEGQRQSWWGDCDQVSCDGWKRTQWTLEKESKQHPSGSLLLPPAPPQWLITHPHTQSHVSTGALLTQEPPIKTNNVYMSFKSQRAYNSPKHGINHISIIHTHARTQCAKFNTCLTWVRVLPAGKIIHNTHLMCTQKSAWEGGIVLVCKECQPVSPQQKTVVAWNVTLRL